MFFSVLCLLCVCAHLFICALWSPAGKSWRLGFRLWCLAVSFSRSHLIDCCSNIMYYFDRNLKHIDVLCCQISIKLKHYKWEGSLNFTFCVFKVLRCMIKIIYHSCSCILNDLNLLRTSDKTCSTNLVYILSLSPTLLLHSIIHEHSCEILNVCKLFVYLISGDTDYRSANMPIILPLILTTTLSLSCTALTYVPQEECLYITFILFTVFRSYLFSFEVTFINDRYVLQFRLCHIRHLSHASRREAQFYSL